MRELYSITKRLSGKSFSPSSGHIKDKTGKLLVEDDAIEARWVEHFNEVLNRPQAEIAANIEPARERLNINCDPPSRTEVAKAIKCLKNNKSAGPDNLTAELLKVDVGTTIDILNPLIEKIWEQEIFPRDWKNSHIITLPKKGDLTDCNNYRGISLLSVPGKVICKIILERMKSTVDKDLRKNQAGFRPGRSCTDQISTLRIILEQCQEFNAPLYLNFIDYSKAFDSVDRDRLWKIMAHYGVPETH